MYNLPPEIFEEFLDFFGGMMEIYSVLFVLSSIIGIALFVLNGIGIMKMSNSLNISNGWLAFIPFASIFAFGRVGQRYIKKDGRPSTKFSVLLLALYILMSVLAVILTVLLIIFLLTLIVYAEDVIANDTALTMDMFKGAIPVIVCTFVILAVEIVYMILYYVCLWRVYSIFDAQNATLFLVLSLFFTFMTPIFIFALRNKQPKVTIEERESIYKTFNNTNDDAPMM